MYIYKAVKKDKRYIPPKESILEFATEALTIIWLEENGGGTYRNILHNFEYEIEPKEKIIE